jgi:hypothetical protein
MGRGCVLDTWLILNVTHKIEGQKMAVDRNTIIAAKIILVLGLLATTISIFNFTSAANSTDWSYTTGRVIESKLLRASKQGGSRGRMASVKYVYTVNGNNYQNDRISYLHSLGYNTVPNREFVNNHPVGTQIKVYYDPSEPSHSTLIPGRSSRSDGYGVFVTGIIMVLASSVLLYFNKQNL